MCWGSYWGTGGGWPFGMFVFPLLLIVFIGLIFFIFSRIGNNSFQRFNITNNETLSNEVRSLRQEIEELRKEQKNKN
ncbi:hypothetical protein SAMN02745975_01581 [Geosporobacter subterraneus DSM 17957]|uniref:DUF4083 domain-containing protein n=2 Tax=Thermotaleaceae TaxID=3118657 RepID=A0A1M6HNS1_9FIRM|nr:hypothetical protein SAMN02745975_01581 [Geosporobacter subterraneus DSM 17957]